MSVFQDDIYVLHKYGGLLVCANIPMPKDCFLHTLAKVSGKQRWKDFRGRLYEWDRFHGHIEQYNSRGIHIGVLDKSGKYIGKAVKGRRIES